MKLALDLIFPQNLIKEPVIFDMTKKFGVIFNLRRAKVTDTVGEIVLELDGDKDSLDKATAYLKSRGVKVEPITHDTMES
jgi:ABC-type methionine transport system ATPase subunit